MASFGSVSLVSRPWLRTRWLPWATLLAAAVLSPLAGWLGAVAARRKNASDPPACYGLGWGCDLSPSTAGGLTALFYLALLAALAIIVGLLHLGGNRLAPTRALVALVGVLGFWAWAAIGTMVA